VAAVLPEGRRDIIIIGCEAHVCVLQTAVGLKAAGHRVFVVADAVASRKAASKQMAIERMRQHAIDIVSTEMVVFEWLETAEHEKFKDVVAWIK
jgi:isochorismate hydrolase